MVWCPNYRAKLARSPVTQADSHSNLPAFPGPTAAAEHDGHQPTP